MDRLEEADEIVVDGEIPHPYVGGYSEPNRHERAG